MNEFADWIKVAIMILAIVVTISLDSCVTRREMNARFDGIQNQFQGIQNQFQGIQNQFDQAANDRALIREDIRRIEDKLEQLTQNYIDHLARHNNPDKQ